MNLVPLHEHHDINDPKDTQSLTCPTFCFAGERRQEYICVAVVGGSICQSTSLDSLTVLGAAV